MRGCSAYLAALGIPLVIYGVVEMLTESVTGGLVLLGLGGVLLIPFAVSVRDEL